MAILSHSPHVCHFVLEFVVSCPLRYDLKLKASDNLVPRVSLLPRKGRTETLGTRLGK